MLKHLHRWRILKSLILAGLTCFGIVAISYLFWQPPTNAFRLADQGRKWFTNQSLITHISDLFDLGVVDVNSDKVLDIYTSNHSSGQFLLLGEGNGKYAPNRISQFGLDQDPAFPGLEDFGPEPPLDAPGLYIYWQGRTLVFQAHQAENIDAMRGSISLSSSIEVKQRHQFDAKVDEKKLPSGADSSKVEFAARSATSKLVVDPYNVSLPIHFILDGKLPLNQVYIGNNKINPSTHDFTLFLRDRHGMAWADYDGKELLDVFIVRGALRGRMDLLPERYTDELLVAKDASHYENQIDQAEIVKGGCPASQTAWVDFDRDGLLDIYTVCFTPLEADQPHPNRLYRQTANRKFIEVAAEVNLDIPESGTFAWLDADRDGDDDMFWADTDAFWLYVNNSGKFEPQRIGANPGTVTSNFSSDYKLTVADYDRDGDIDVFFASADASVLLNNTGKTYEIVNPESIGLPLQSLTANWVDYDNDGLTDLHLMPGGLYRQKPDATFEETHLLEDTSGVLKTALVAWLDANNDGSRDLLMATRYQEPVYEDLYKKIFKKSLNPSGPSLTLYSNVGSTHHWLEVELTGLPGNRQAIGSLVEVVTPAGTQLQVVGQSEGSHYSQGHYRLYFGLGQQQNVDAVKIYWPDGSVQEIRNPGINQLLAIQREVPPTPVLN